MFSALVYLQFHSVKNRLVSRIKRLKQPKYLVGAIAGGLYFYWYFFRWMFRPYGGNGIPTSRSFTSPENMLLYESVAALILFVIILLAWVIPHKRAALTFSEAEIAFLFPAPVTRRTLIHFKIMRSQLGILFTAFLLALVSRSTGSHFWMRVVSCWIVFTILRLHFLGSSFALTMLMERGIANWKRRLGVLVAVLVGATAVCIWAVQTLPPLKQQDLETISAFLDYSRSLFESGPMPYLIFPFRLIVRPSLATDIVSFLSAVWPALLLMAAHYWWVVRSDVAFEEASVEASQRLAEKVAAVRAGNWQNANRKLKRKRAPFNLRPTGFPLVALFWKNLISAGSVFTGRIWIFMVMFVLFISFSVRSTSSNWASVVGAAAGMLCVWTLLLGPQIVRQDLRQDLQNADLLKMYPLHGWQVVLGEILAPAAILTGLHWLLLILASILFSQFGGHGVSVGLKAAIGLGAALVLPLLNVILLLIPNAAALLFPAWFQSGREGPHGIEATGQRLIFALGQVLAFVVILVPVVAVSAVFFFVIKAILGMAMAVLVAAVASALVLGIEAGLGIALLGRWFGRFDISTEMTA